VPDRREDHEVLFSRDGPMFPVSHVSGASVMRNGLSQIVPLNVPAIAHDER
jgi:hypothetical protein